MGAKCCMPVRDDMPMILRKKYKPPHELNARRSNRCSPSWSFRCDNRTHIEDITDSPGWGSHIHHGSLVSEFKSTGDMEIEGLSDGSSFSDAFQTPEWQKFSNQLSIRGNSPTATTDLSAKGNMSHEEREICEFSNTMIASEPKASSVDQVDPPSSGVCSQPSPTSSGKSCLLPVPRFSREDSESRVPTLDSVSEDGRPSFVLSFSSNDLSAGEFQYGSSDGWSLRSFSEFVLSSDSSQRNSRNTQLSSSFFSCDLRTCGLCSKLLKERASWKDNEIGIAAVLVCGHVYHAECLENVTPEASKFDPSCPTCTHGESSTGKALIKPVLKTRNKISRRAVADIDDVDGNFMPELQKSGSCIVKDPRFGASSSRKNSFGRTFLRKHFSMGSQSVKLPPPRESSKKKGFWARYR